MHSCIYLTKNSLLNHKSTYLVNVKCHISSKVPFWNCKVLSNNILSIWTLFVVSYRFWSFYLFSALLYSQRYMADIGKSWPVLIVCGGILPLFLAVIWLLMIRHFVAAMPWVTVVLFNILIISVTMFYYLKGEEHVFSIFLLGAQWFQVLIQSNFKNIENPVL